MTNWTQRKSVRSWSQKIWSLTKKLSINWLAQIFLRDSMTSLNWWKTLSFAIKPANSNKMLKLSGNPCTGKLFHRQEWKKVKMFKSKFKAMLVVFFNIKQHRNDWMGSKGSNLNQAYYSKVLATLQERVCKKWPELWKDKPWISHQDNALAHNVLMV